MNGKAHARTGHQNKGPAPCQDRALAGNNRFLVRNDSRRDERTELVMRNEHPCYGIPLITCLAESTPMTKDPKRARARKSVARKLQAYMTFLMKQVTKSSDELLRRAEGHFVAQLHDRSSIRGT